MKDFVVNIIIICVVTGLVNCLRTMKKKQDEEDKNNDLVKGEFVIQYNIALKIITVLAGAFFIPVFIINLGNWLLGWEIGKGSDQWTVLGFGVFVALVIYMFMGIFIWKITVCEKGTKIIYRDYIGIKHIYYFKDLDKVVEKKNGDLIAYQNGKRIFTISENLPLGVFFYCWARDHKKLIEKK